MNNFTTHMTISQKTIENHEKIISYLKKKKNELIF